MTVLAEQFDVLLLDLDGTVYLGGTVIDHVQASLAQAASLGARSMYVTNNASRSPAEVAGSLIGMGLTARDDDVLTSPEAAASMLAATHPPGSKILVVGAPALADAVAAVDLVPVRLVSDDPVAVVQGHSPDTGWRDLAEACIALRGGVDWVACNTDTTLPTDRGLLPGNGAMVQALVAATGLRPRVAGKPNRPLLDEAVRRSAGRRPLVVGDRLDTDIEAGVTASMPSLFVLTGVSTAADLLAAPAHQRPSHLAMDLRGLIDGDRAVDIAVEDSECPWKVATGSDSLELSRSNGAVPSTNPTEPAGYDAAAEPHLTDGAARADDPGTDHNSTGHDAADRPASVSDALTVQALAALARAAWSSGITAVTTQDPTAQAVLVRLGLGEPATQRVTADSRR